MHSALFNVLVLAGFITLAMFADLLRWDSNPPGEGVTNYRVHSGPASRSYDTNWSTGTNTWSQVSHAPQWLAVTAESAAGASAFSHEVLFVPAPDVAGVRLELFAAESAAGPWHRSASIPLAGTNAAEFFKLRIAR